MNNPSMCYNNKSYFCTSKCVSYYLGVPNRTGNRLTDGTETAKVTSAAVITK